MTSRLVVLLGAGGELGTLAAHELRTRGHAVVPASRATGVDASTGAGLQDVLDGADAVIDCTNIATVRRGPAVDFFTSVAEHTTTASRIVSVPHVVVLSILNVTDRPVRSALGYYAGKAAHEETYLASGLPVSVVSTTAWFTLARQILTQARVGPVAMVPRMRLQPVHPGAAASLLADVVDAGPPADGSPSRQHLAGPEQLVASTMARDLAARTQPGLRVVGAPFPIRRAVRDRALLPRGEVRTDPRRFVDWLEEQG